MGILMVIFAISIGYATFIENDFDAKTAKLLIYNAWWFEAIMGLMVVNFTGMTFTKRLYRKSKLNILAMHISLIIIIIGAGVTRYFGFEGQMHIREGQTSNEIITYDDYVNIVIDDQETSNHIYDKIVLSPINKNIYHKSTELNGKDIDIEIEKYMPNAQEILQPDESGDMFLNMVTASRTTRKNFYLKENEINAIEGLLFNFGDTTDSRNVQVMAIDTGLIIRSPYPIQPAQMGEQEMEILEANVFHPAALLTIYSIHNVTFVIREVIDKARLTFVPVRDDKTIGSNIVSLRISVDKEDKLVMLKKNTVEDVYLNGVKFNMKIGSQIYTIPFDLKLNKFELDRYPGSFSPSSFASEVTLIDKKANLEKPFRIFMNNILNYKGYRFYQSSYDKDEKGTILSVNHDYWGTWITYFGYFLLFATLIISLFTKKTRFARLSEQIQEIHSQRKKLVVSLLILFVSVISISFAKAQNKIIAVDKDHATAFGKLLVQNKDGRIIPINTIASSSLVKVYKKSSYKNLTSDQVFLGMLASPKKWKQEPLIKIYAQAVRDLISIESNYASFNDFFDEGGNYILKEQVDKVYIKSPAQRSTFDKEIMNVDERVNVSYMVYNGSLAKIFPVQDDPNNGWITPPKFMMMNTPDKLLYNNYISKLNEAITKNDYSQVEPELQAIKDYQLKYGKAIIPSETKTNLEVLYNNVNIFKRLFPIYMTVGIILLGLFLVQLFKPAWEFKKIITIFYVILIISFLAQTLGLAVRWYISEHAPWSNGYESMIYIAWATVLAGFIFMKKSPMTLSVTAILAGITLLTAHMSWLNPEITNLVPVLKSYWLTFHVATITASYGFLALGSLMGFLNLFIMIFRNKTNHVRVNLTLKELTYTIEMSLMVGLILLVIGNFLGGIWANESWGRYWGWDPKETWSLVTIIVYSFILHMRLIPGMRNLFSISFMAHIGFGSVLMTYFGVNYYLSGLHSYAQGDPVPVPTFVYYLVGAILVVGILALMNDVKMRNLMPAMEQELDDKEIE